MNMTDLWLDLCITPKDGNQRKLLPTFVIPLMDGLEKSGAKYRTLHFLHEPSGFLFRVCGAAEQVTSVIRPTVETQLAAIGADIRPPVFRSDHRPYVGEEATYARNGWAAMELLLEMSSRVALMMEQFPPERGRGFQIERMTHCFWNAMGMTLKEEINLGIEGVFQRALVLREGRDTSALLALKGEFGRRLAAMLQSP